MPVKIKASQIIITALACMSAAGAGFLVLCFKDLLLVRAFSVASVFVGAIVVLAGAVLKASGELVDDISRKH